MKKNYLFILSAILLIGITFSAIQITRAWQDEIVDNPGHLWAQLYNFPDDCTGNDFVKGFNSVDGLKCFTPEIKIDTTSSYDGTIQTDGFACTDMDSTTIGGDVCNNTNRGMIRIRETTCGTKVRDSLCYCGLYDGTYEWICLISCP